MKRILISAAILLGAVAAQSQDDGYTPLVREGSEWCYWANENTDNQYSFYVMRGDTTAYNRTYKIAYKVTSYVKTDDNGNPYFENYDEELFCCMREEGHKVFRLIAKGYSNAPGAGGIIYETFDMNEQAFENLMYDFDDMEAYFKAYHISKQADQWDDYAVPAVDENILGGNTCYKLGGLYKNHYAAEGIGFYSHIKQYGNFGWRAMSSSSGPRDAGTNFEALVYMKNPQGEFEYLDEEKYSKIKDILEKPSAVTDVAVPTRPADGKAYNILGQPVGDDYKGLVIKDGKKFIQQ